MLANLRNRYRQLENEITERTIEKTALSKAIQTLSAVCGEPANIDILGRPTATDPAKAMTESWLRYMPFADAIRTALRIISPLAFTTSELREMLVRAGYPIETKPDFMIALNVALKRLHDSEEVEIVSKDMRKAYRWAFKNELQPPPPLGDSPLIDWEGIVKQTDKSQDELADDHPVRKLAVKMRLPGEPIRNDLPKTPGEAKERMKKFAHGRTVPPPPGLEEEK
jgi:hypothetical protein